jgi:F0F1-type ATP synthase assembly protein I
MALRFADLWHMHAVIDGGRPGETPEEREKRKMSYELEAMARDKVNNEHKMANERQQQDYEMAMRARLIVGWIVGASIVGALASITVLGGIWLSHR